MGRKKKLALFLFVLDVVILAVGCLSDTLLIFASLNILGLMMLVFLWLGNRMLLKSPWYRNLLVDYDHEIYPDNVWYRAHDERNFDLVNLGSSSSVYAFDYAGYDVKAMNWARQPQTLLDDIRLVKNFHSILKEGGYVLISIMPFTSINKQTGLLDAVRYGQTVADVLLEEKYRRKANFLARYPIFMGKRALKEVVKALIGYHQNVQKWQQPENNLMSEAELEADAMKWDKGWRQQFSIADYKDPLTKTNAEGRQVRIQAMRDLIDFCQERGYKPIYVILPMTKQLRHYLHDEFLDKYVYEYLKQVERDVPVLDYLKDEEMLQPELYANAYFLNKQGARKFTGKVLQAIDDGVI